MLPQITRTTGRTAIRFVADWEKLLRTVGTSLEEHAHRQQIGPPAS